MTLDAVLNAFFAEVFRKGFGYRPDEVDCCRFAADWVVWNGGPDPAAEWRGRYSSEAEALVFVAAAGGVHRILDKGMGAAGLASTRVPCDGDVGCVRTAVVVEGHTQRLPVGAIHFGGVWWTLTEVGILPLPAQTRAIAAWEVLPCRQ
ncbi:DUF6950 family protein [Pseudovibrio exalbescens]|uniref:DUF6950 domain-containing protein n=1 Tax=Pseudovibrio exalbescens TaxID=197461 RepID=A0A1U7JJY6_9HYPH|nr:hypothetical protein [Pseudovibrio exalbescens]OKL45004.1 hypothetical protein A3843_05310 [Pseudovibrio exalbescens]